MRVEFVADLDKIKRRDDALREMWCDLSLTVMDIAHELGVPEGFVRTRADKMGLGKRWKGGTTVSNAGAVLRPPHATAPVGTREWAEQCDSAYIEVVRRYHPEREVRLR